MGRPVRPPPRLAFLLARANKRERATRIRELRVLAACYFGGNHPVTAAFTAAQLAACIAANTCHQVPYDYLRGENFFQLDALFGRFFKFGERARVELFFQAFDLTNRANFGTSYGGNIRTSTFQQPTGFITSSGVIVPKSFAGEFGARFSF